MTNPVRFLRLQSGTCRRIAVGLLVVVWLTQSLQLATAAGRATPIQPDSLTASHRSGQTFLTWHERTDLTAERYRIYRHSAPISAANLADAHLLAEIGEGSSTFFAGRYQDYAIPPNWAYRYSDRLIIENDGTALNGDTGLLVWTLAITDFSGAASGTGYYAVTTVADGVENQSDFGPGNTVGPVAEAVALPQPVRIQQNANGWQVYLQYMDLRNWNPTFHAPNPLNGYYGLTSTSPGVPGALQYAYDYALYVPDAAHCGGELPASLPLLVNLHAWGGNTYGPFTGAAGPWCAYILAPVDQSETWWFGFARDKDYRQGGQPTAGDVIVNYTEQRLLQMIDFVLRQPPGPPTDANRVYVSGFSMGGGGALALAMRYPQVFAAANASKPVTDHRTAGWTFSTIPRWGDIAANLPVVVAAPNGWADALQPYAGVGIWDWQNLIRDLTVRGHAPMTPLGLDFGINDTAVPWSAQGEPFFVPLDASRQSWGAIVGEDGHTWGAYRGLPPNLRLDSANVPFAGLQVVRNESTPGFSQASADPSLPPSAIGRFHHTLLWSATWLPWDGAPLDTSHQWQVSLCAVATDATACGGGETQQVTVTPRRLQHFAPVAGAAYTWENWSISVGAVAARGVITAGVDGLLTTPPVTVGPTGNRLLLLEGAAPTAVETFTASVVGGVVILDWTTVAETPGTLFHIQRAAAVDGPYTRINATALPATGAPGDYTFTDRPSSGIYYYRLEDVDGVGNSRLRGPVRVVRTALTMTVQSAADDGTANAANCPGPNCRLRDAIAAAATDDAINFGGNFAITLVSQLMIDKNLIIDGTGHAVTVSGNHLTRVFNVTAGHVTFDTLTITDGHAQTLDCFFPSLQCGGGIMIQNMDSVVTVTHSTLSGNSAHDIGGGIFNSRGLLTVKDSTLSGNSATYGGGIANDWTLVVQNSTFASNLALEGGGVYNSYGPLTMTHSTIAGNSATSSGGGILNYAGVLNLSHTLIADSLSGGDCRNQSGGSVVANDHNLIEATGLDACALSDGNGGSFIGVDPQLGPLGNYGGSTRTFALLPSSPAIDAGNPASCLPIDQRGQSRDDLRCDIGAYELKYADSPTVIRSVSRATTTTFGPALIGIMRDVALDPGAITVTKSLTWKTPSDNAIDAYWSITPTVNSGLNLTLTLCYTPTESNGLDLSALRFWRFRAGAWNFVPGTPITSTVGSNSCATLAGVNELSIWTLATGQPTAVTLTALSARTALDAERRLELALSLLSLVFLVNSGGWWLWRRKSTL